MSLREAWEANAGLWLSWARAPGHDSYWQFHRDRFLELVPSPGRLTLDLGAGEGRLSRDLATLGHRVVALDASPTLASACATHPRPVPSILADAAQAPLAPGCADLVVAFMSLHDVDDLSAVVTEVARLLANGGRLVLAVVHPLNSAGRFEGESADPNAPFVVRGSYLASFRYQDIAERDGLTMRFHSLHRPLQDYCTALEDGGFVLESLRELSEPNATDRWGRIPLFLHLRARRATP